VDCVTLGESVCSRRHLLRLDDWLEVAAALRDAGKQVVLSTQTLIESESDLKALRKIVANGAFWVEANEFGAVHRCAEVGIPFVAGPALNVYNPDTLALLREAGAVRWVPPVEMPQAMLKEMAVADGMETELFAYGRLPLAFSARCFTARHYGLQKDDCQFRCLDHPDGLRLDTREGQPFLILNGIQTQSAKVYTLAHRMAEIESLGVSHLRLSPQSRRMAQVVELFDALRRHAVAPLDAAAQLQKWMPGEPCDGYWLGRPGLDYVPEHALL
jgi:collagenase-like PrtC family protease